MLARLRLLGLLALAFWFLAGAARTDEPAWSFRSLPKPKVLYLADSPNREEFAEKLRANVSANVAFAPLNYSDQEFHHLCDKPLEEAKEETEQVIRKGRQYVDGLLERLDSFDLVMAQFQPSAEREIQKRLTAWVQKGGRLVFINPSWETTFEGTPLAEVLPVRFTGRKTWTSEFAGAAEHPISRGLAMEVLGAHWYGPIYEPADASCVPLTRAKTDAQGAAQAARFWYRRLPGGGQTVHLFTADGSKWPWQSGTHYAAYAADRPDDSAVWNALYRRLVYWLVYGDKAFPVPCRVLRPEAAPPCQSGQKLGFVVELENLSGADGEFKVAIDIGHRRTARSLAETRTVSLKAGRRTAVPFDTAVDLPSSDSCVLVRARVLDGPGKTALSESTLWVPYVHAVPLTLKTDRPSYAPGEKIRVTASWPKEAVLAGRNAALYLVDYSGRAVAKTDLALRPGPPAEGEAVMTMPEEGPETLSAYWLVAVAGRGDRIDGIATAQVQLDRPWDMRRQFQWSVWTNGAEARKMALYRDAGFNALGMIGNNPQADRYGLGQYVEGTGINTFGVEIEHDNWAAVRAAMEKTIDQQNRQGPDARSKRLVSLGEESGFQGGWGTRYYWPKETAPPLVQEVFGDYLKELYGGNLAELNRQWGGNYTGFDRVPLEKAKVTSPGRVFVTSQAWEAMQKKGETKNTAPVNVAAPDAKQEFLARSAPYVETYQFFDWYYQKYCDLATQVYRTRRNPVPRTIMSAPGGFYPKVDVYNFAGLGPFYPKETALAENAVARRDYGEEPGFSAAMWAYFDLRSLWNATVLSSLLAGNTHLDYWVDVPLTFNADLTHTRASFWTKVLREQLRPIEPILLHKRFAATKGLGMFAGRQPLAKGLLGDHFGSAIHCNAPVYSALEESGYQPRVVQAAGLEGLDVVVASYAEVVAPEECKRLADFVRRGGLLISTPWLASCSPHGNVLTVYPAAESGLADLLGFKLLNTSQQVITEEVGADLSEAFPAAGHLTLVSKGRDKVLAPAADVQVLARYKDGTPLVLARKVGRGRIVHLNLVYDWSGWWSSFHEPPREAYRKLFDGILRADGRVKPDYFIAFESTRPSSDNKGWWAMAMKTQPRPGESVPWWASQLYADPSGRIKYLGVFADHRSPQIAARVHLADRGARVRDLLSGRELAVTDGAVLLELRPGEAAFWAITPAAPPALRFAAPAEVQAGAPIRLAVELPGNEQPAAAIGLTVEVRDPAGNRSPAHSLWNVTATGAKAEIAVPTALNDPAGTYRITVTEGLTRSKVERTVQVRAAEQCPDRSVLCPFPPRPGEQWQPSEMSDAEFLALLRGLRQVYLGTHSGLEAKYLLSYYLNVPFRPEGRHAIVRRLQRTDWRPHLPALCDAIRSGQRFCLLGEDLNVDPQTGTWIDPLAACDPRAVLEELARALGVRRRTAKAEGLDFEVFESGKGTLVVGRASVDRAAYHSSDFAAWHETLKRALTTLEK